MEIVLKIIKGFAGLRLYLILISCRAKLVRGPWIALIYSYEEKNLFPVFLRCDYVKFL